MLKRSLFLLAMLGLLVSVQAQNAKYEIAKKAPLMEEITTTQPVNGFIGGISTPALNGWVAIDTMQNAYGPAISALNPLAYDPGSNVVAMVHRGRTTYAAGSGEMWYNISTDKGQTWTRVQGGINAAAPAKNGRYPAMAISNPTNGPIAGTTGLFTWAELVSGSFGGVGFGADQPLGAGGGASFIDAGRLYSSQVPSWASANSPWMYWVSDNQTDASIKFFRTQDFVTVDTVTPPQWESAVFQDNGNVAGGGASALDGTIYMAVIGSFVPPDTNNPILSGWFPGVSKSTDNGTTWSDFEVVDFRQIPALAKYDRLFDYKKGDTFISYHTDVNVDKYGLPHLIITVTDTVGSDNTGINAIAEIYKTQAGTWSGKVIYEGIPDNSYFLEGAALAQMGPSGYLAMDKTRDKMVVQWTSPDPAVNDSICDIWLSYKTVDGAAWSAPMNITNTTGMNENSTHLAPMLADGANASEFIAFSNYTYAAGYTGYWPNDGSVLAGTAAVLYVKATPITMVGVEDNTVPANFSLNQNYPNPFNPATTINFSLSSRSNVSLKVYDIIGREVATLVNGVKEVGTHTVNFDGANLASGMYFYTLTAGNFTATKKMMLVK